MDKTTPPTTVTPSPIPPGLRAPVPPRAGTGPDGEGLSSYRSNHWAEPAGPRKFMPLIVVGAIAAAALIGVGYKYDKEHADDATLARGPAVESLVNSEPTAAGPADAASAVTDMAPATTTEPAVPAVTPEPTPAPTLTPRAPAAPATSNARPNRTTSPLPRPNDNDSIPVPVPDQPARPPEPEVTQPLRTTPPVPALETPAQPTTEPPLQPPAVEPLPTPSPVPAPVQ